MTDTTVRLEAAHLASFINRVQSFQDTAQLPYELRLQLNDALIDLGADIDFATTAAAPPWDRAAEMLTDLRQYAQHPYVGINNIDQMSAYCVNWLDAATGLDLRDERTLFTALGVLGLLNECAGTGEGNGVITKDEAQAVRVIIKVVGAALSTLAPKPVSDTKPETITVLAHLEWSGWCHLDDCPSEICNGPHHPHRCGSDLVSARYDNTEPCHGCAQPLNTATDRP